MMFAFKESLLTIVSSFPWVAESMKVEDPCGKSGAHEIIYFILDMYNAFVLKMMIFKNVTA